MPNWPKSAPRTIPNAERRDTYLAKREREIAALKGEVVEEPGSPPQT